MAACCHGPSHGIDPSFRRLRISSADPRTSVYEPRSNPRGFIASTSVLRNKGLISFEYPNMQDSLRSAVHCGLTIPRIAQADHCGKSKLGASVIETLALPAEFPSDRRAGIYSRGFDPVNPDSPFTPSRRRPGFPND